MRQYRGIPKNKNDQCGEFIYGWLRRTPLIAAEIYSRDLGETIEVWLHTVGQNTGLKDKNGTEAYRNDKVKGEYAEGIIKFGEHETSTDYYGSSAYGWYVEAGHGNTHSILQIGEWEIIGTIHDEAK